MVRTLEVYKEYFWEFFDKLPDHVKEKIDYIFDIIVNVERIPTKFFKHVEDNIYEIRIEVI